MRKPFHIGPWWTGETAVVIGGGPSLTLAQTHVVARARLEGKCRVLAVNDAVYAAWWADWLHACDFKWWQAHIQRVQRFPGIKTTLDPSVPALWVDGCLNNTGLDGFDHDTSACRTGGNSVYQAMHCLMHAHVRRILLLGVDMKGHGAHWFGDHPWGGTCDHAKEMVPHFKTLLPELHARNIRVENCSPGSALQDFPHIPIGDALCVQ